MSGKIIIGLEGSGDDRGDVRLTEFVDQLDSLRKALSYAEQHASATARNSAVYYRVVDLHHSTATLELEAVPVNPLEDRTSAVIYQFNTRLRQIASGRVPDDVSVEELEAYGELAPSRDRHLRAVTIAFDAPSALRPADPVRVTSAFQEKVAELIGPEEVAWGTMTGFMDAINLHERNVFHLWPRVGPKRLHCTFDRSIREEVKAAIDHFVEVAGRIHYRSRDFMAHRMTAVYSVEVLDKEAPAHLLSDLRGIAPDATNGMNTRDFVDSYDEDW